MAIIGIESLVYGVEGIWSSVQKVLRGLWAAAHVGIGERRRVRGPR